jgi:PKD repeat protein
MTFNLARAYWLTCVLMMTAAAAEATTIVLPTDEQLIAKSPVIVAGTIVQSTPVLFGDKIWTETILAVDRTFKGDVAGRITIREIGGVLDNRITKIFGAPQYAAGERVLAFLTPRPRGDYQTVDLYVGKFSEQQTLAGRRIWQRNDITADAALVDGNFQSIQARNVQRDGIGFEQYVADRVAGRSGLNNYGVENPLLVRDMLTASRRIAPEFTLISEPTIYRWFAFDRGSTVPWYSYGTQPGYTGGGANEVQTAMSSWTGYSAALIRYSYAGTGTGAPAPNSVSNGINEIGFNDPNQEISGSWNASTGGVVGLGGFNGVASGGNWTSPFTADSSHMQGTFRAYEITEAFLEIQDGVSPTAGIPSAMLAEIIAHEFGHTLGLGHSADNTALMYPTVTGRGPSLRSDDQLAARWLYPNGSAPTPTPAVPGAPSNLTATSSGSDIYLTWSDNATSETGQYIYVAAGSGSFTRVGDAGANANSSRLTGASPGTYRIYLTAYNSAGESSPSNTATVTVAAPAPTPAPSAAFSVSTMSGIAGSTAFIFTDQSTGSITSRSWNFGDGGTSSLSNPTHSYSNAGTYTVVLTVSGSGGQSQATHFISVSAPAPAVPNVNAAFDFSPASPTVRDPVTFVDRSTGSPTRWSWSFGDGGTSNLQNPTHAYLASGTYTINVTIFSSTSSSSATRTITVNPMTPVRTLVSVTAQTSGIGGSAWRTELTLFNAGSEAATGQYLFLPGAGGSEISRPLYLEPKQTMTFSNALLDIFGMSSGAGAVVIEASSPSSAALIKLTSRTYTTGSNGTYGQGVPNVATADLQQTMFLTGLESDADYRTNIGLVNRSDSPASAKLTLYDGGGSIVASSTVTVAANNFQQASLATYFPEVANRSFNALSMRADISVPDAVSVYASVVDNHTQDPIYLQASTMPSGLRTTIPVVVRAPGANGTFWRSDVRLFNPTGSVLPLTLRYQGATMPLLILPNQTAVLSDIVSQFGSSSGSGAVEVLWTAGLGPIIASRTYTTAPSGGTYGQSIDATQAFGSDGYVTGLRSDDDFRSNIGFVNGSDSTIGVTATLLASSGTTVATAFVQLPPHGQVQYSLGALFLTNVNVASLGAVTVQAHTDSGAVLFAYGSIVDNHSGDPVFYAGQ